MGEVDTVFYIKQVYTNLAINKPWLAHRDIDDPKKFLKALRRNSYFHGKRRKPILEDIVHTAFMDADNTKKSGRMSQYQLHEQAILEYIKNTTDLTIPIFTEGTTVTGFGRAEKEGIDPYSNSHLFTTLLIAHAYYHHDISFLKKLQFWSVQPVTYVSEFFEEHSVPGIREIVAPQLPDWRGTLYKNDDIAPKIGNSRFNPTLLDHTSFAKRYIAPEE
ncbi:MAG TPA: hypothetical protein VK158_03405, partial [Acidobacteriota bacterium]|nr:hypothetical protein [Acidobacteriota bacterium]